MKWSMKMKTRCTTTVAKTWRMSIDMCSVLENRIICIYYLPAHRVLEHLLAQNPKQWVRTNNMILIFNFSKKKKKRLVTQWFYSSRPFAVYIHFCRRLNAWSYKYIFCKRLRALHLHILMGRSFFLQQNTSFIPNIKRHAACRI